MLSPRVTASAMRAAASFIAVSTCGIGHRLLDRRIEKRLDRIGLDIAAGDDARQQFRKIVALRDGERARGAALVEPVAPRASGRRILDAKEEAILSHLRDCSANCDATPSLGGGHPHK